MNERKYVITLKILEQLIVHWPFGKEYINTISTNINMVFDNISLLSFVYKMCNIYQYWIILQFATHYNMYGLCAWLNISLK